MSDIASLQTPSSPQQEAYAAIRALLRVGK
jgi:hypothetical protein